jgi:hypothetical protein
MFVFVVLALADMSVIRLKFKVVTRSKPYSLAHAKALSCPMTNPLVELELDVEVY